MKMFFSLCSILFVTSCQRHIPTGTYFFNSREKFIINSGNGYEYYNGGAGGTVIFSSGHFKLDRRLVTFSEDSNNFCRITVLSSYYDTLLGNQRKLILGNMSDSLRVFYFSSHISGIADVRFSDDYTIIYTPSGIDKYSGGFSVHAKLSNAASLAPPPYNDSITSNEIKFSEVKSDEPGIKGWNTLIIGIDINEDMFTIKTPTAFRYKHKRLIKTNWPVFELSLPNK